MQQQYVKLGLVFGGLLLGTIFFLRPGQPYASIGLGVLVGSIVYHVPFVRTRIHQFELPRNPLPLRTQFLIGFFSYLIGALPYVLLWGSDGRLAADYYVALITTLLTITLIAGRNAPAAEELQE